MPASPVEPADDETAETMALGALAADPVRALRAVEALLRARLTALAEEWRALGSHPDPILGEHDVPGILAALVLEGGKRIRPQMAHWGWVASGAAARGDDPSPAHAVGAATSRP